MNKYKSKEKDRMKRRSEFKDTIIDRKNEEIEELKELILNLQITCEEKDEIIYAVEDFHKDMNDIIDELNELKKEYKSIQKEIFEMRNSLNEIVFNNKWKIIRRLLK